MASNTLVVVQGHDNLLLLRRSLNARDASWVSGDAPAEGAAHSAKTRYRQADSTCIVTRSDDEGIALEFARPQWAVTPGQSVVLYDGPVCLGGAVIG
jgi:tRNA-specific 2-thiouridylase